MQLTNSQLRWFALGLTEVYSVYAQSVTRDNNRLLGNVVTTKRAYEEIMSRSGLGMAVPMNEAAGVQIDQVLAGFSKIYTPVIMTKGYSISEQAVEQDQFGAVTKWVPEMTKAFVDRMNFEAAQVYNLSFAGSGRLLPDGVTLIATNHPYPSGGPSGTWSNRGDRNNVDQTLSALALEETIQLFNRQTDHRGLPMRVNGQLHLVVPPELEGLAHRVVKSSGLAGTADNDINWIKGRISDIIVSEWLGWEDTALRDAWWVKAASNNEHKLFTMVRSGVKFYPDFTNTHFVHIITAKEEYVCDAMDGRGIRGHNP